MADRLERSGDPAQHLSIARTLAGWLRGAGKMRIFASCRRWYVRTLTVKHSLPTTLNPFTEDPMLTTHIEQWTASVKATSKAEGKAEGRVAAILELVQTGDLSRVTAELRLRHLAEQGLAESAQIEAALRCLG